MSNSTGRLIVVSGASGSGKTTLCDRLERDYNCEYVVTATTRAPRKGEVNGVDYNFYEPDEFERRERAGEFLEHAIVHGNYYGTPRKSVESALARGATLILEIDTQGAAQIRNSKIKHTNLFIDIPDMATLEQRLRGRKTDAEETIAQRIARAHSEIAEGANYDFRVVNDDLERAVFEIAIKLSLTKKK
ncbi:MAG: guanylate kinase [Planctomycetes bacterium]|nr:guanylate kinase [Planctomycetota bacterium]